MSLPGIRTLGHLVEGKLKERGYVLRWEPLAAVDDRRLTDAYFELAAAWLTLKRRHVFFVNIGANDGVSIDPIHPFVRDHGWGGVMVEPMPEAFRRLSANYAGFPGIRCIEAAIAEADGAMPLFYAEHGSIEGTDRVDASVYASFNRETLLKQTKWIPDIADKIRETTVPVMSWNTLRKEIGDRRIDVIKIDTEGYDYNILRMINFDEICPSIIHYERAHMTKAQQNEIADALVTHGYIIALGHCDVTAFCLQPSQSTA